MAKKNTPAEEAQPEPEIAQAPEQEQPAPTTEDRVKAIADAVTETATRLMEVLTPTKAEQMLARAGIQIPSAATRCISCGMPGSVTFNDDGFHCGVCGHTWTIEDEQSPFRRLQQGRL